MNFGDMNFGDRVLVWFEQGSGDDWAGGLIEGTVWYIFRDAVGVRLGCGTVLEIEGIQTVMLFGEPLTGLLITGGRMVLET